MDPEWVAALTGLRDALAVIAARLGVDLEPIVLPSDPPAPPDHGKRPHVDPPPEPDRGSVV